MNRRPLLVRAQVMLLVAGLGLVVALTPQWIVPRFGLETYLALVALAVVALASLAIRRRG